MFSFILKFLGVSLGLNKLSYHHEQCKCVSKNVIVILVNNIDQSNYWLPLISIEKDKAHKLMYNITNCI